MTADSLSERAGGRSLSHPDDPSAGLEPEDRRAVRSATRAFMVLVVAAVLLVAVRLLLVQSFVIPTASMEPTLKVGQRVLVSRMDYRFGSVHRGDVIVFDGDGVFDPVPTEPRSSLARIGHWFAAAVGAPVGEHDYVKRVIGLPGERVVCCDAQGRITVDGVALNEPYLHPGDTPSAVRFDIVVPAGRLWVMGDNRSVSDDSRDHLGDPGGGTVPLDQVVGRVIAVWWPVSDLSGVGRVDASEPGAARSGGQP